MWTMLRRIKDVSNAPWLMLGDFNETMWQSEHFSRARRSERNMEKFWSVLSDCNLFDLGFKGPSWTFNNKQEGNDNIRARLDRGVASPEWSNIFKEAMVEHICPSRSDHLPVLLRLGSRREWRPVGDRPKPIFRYEQMWERVGSLQTTIEKSWKEKGAAVNMQEVGAKLCTMQTELKGWADQDFGSVIKQTSDIRKKLSKLWNCQPTARNQKEVNKLSKELDELLLREELMWKQRSRATYLREGDKNTKWFQRKAS